MTSVLIVDDEPSLARAYGHFLDGAGYTVELASTGAEAEALVREAGAAFDVIVSDIYLPDVTGLEFLQYVRARNLDVPVILMTGNPGVKSAMGAVEQGAFRYLIKPVDRGQLIEAVDQAVAWYQLIQLKRTASMIASGAPMQVTEGPALEHDFERALSKLWLAYQPIVSWKDKKVVAHEALLRSDHEPLAGPREILGAGERLGAMSRLGQAIRERAAEAIPQLPGNVSLFVNVHASDLNDERLYDPMAPLSQHAARVVLEITERATLDSVGDLREKVELLRVLGYRTAIDDLGAGYAGLSSLAQLHPQVVKLDISLVRGLEMQPTRQRIVESIAKLCSSLNVQVVSEGVETVAERDALLKAGCDLLQGYLFARPGREFVVPTL